ncbi:rab guanine nucleotide exchange factor S2 [Diatrype stigma]|uniref:Rab guanine nucleotide exchange factor S2 n=1 Tax=Diatrype stigma TaxID=117547 RepID=A0AAN9UE67_9PEZI
MHPDTLRAQPHKRMPSSTSVLEDQEHSTIPDPRKRALSSANGGGATTPTHHPDLDHEVAALSTKLINALNHQTTLDDTLSATRQDLEASHERIAELEALVARQQETLAGDVWVKRSSVEGEKHKLLLRIADEKKQRADVEKEKKKIEQELETLTVSLFEEANRMVITAKEEAKKEEEALLRKNEQLKAQLVDTEGLLKSQQEQLAELKNVMEQMTVERDSHIGTAPSSPGLISKYDCKDDDIQTSDGVSQYGHAEPYSPTYPTSFTHLLQPVLRTDISSYDDFMALAKTSKRLSTSRASSGSYGGLSPLLGFTSSGSGPAPSNASTTSVSTGGTPASNNVSPQTPNTPASALSSGSSAPSTPLPPLKEARFYKRVLAEDVEPTLRLDTAPGLSWLARRSVLSAMTEGTLVVEPVPTSSPFPTISKPQFYPCSLCGESRKDPSHLRNHRFRTSESDSAQRYPLCNYCLSRVRSTCDFLGFLRMVKDGHWRADDADAERAAWEESVKLREQMFWSRIGGGVVPAFHGHAQLEKSGHDSQEASRLSADNMKMVESRKPSLSINEIIFANDEGSHDGAQVIEVSHQDVIDSAPSAEATEDAASEATSEATSEARSEARSETRSEARSEARSSIHSLEGSRPRSESDLAAGLSITIPGAFE